MYNVYERLNGHPYEYTSYLQLVVDIANIEQPLQCMTDEHIGNWWMICFMLVIAGMPSGQGFFF